MNATNLKDYEESYVLENLKMSKMVYRFILDDLPKYVKFNQMSYQDKFLILKSEYPDFVNNFPLVVREMICRNYHDKAFKKYLRFIFNYKPSDLERVEITSGDKKRKLAVKNSKECKYMYFLHYYATNKKSKENSEKYYNLCLDQLNKDSEETLNDIDLQKSKITEENEKIKNRHIQEILKELKNM